MLSYLRAYCFGLLMSLELVTLVTSVSAQTTPPRQESMPTLIPRKLLFGNPVKASPKISFDGSRLAYLAPDENDVLNVFVRDLKNPGEDRQVTHDRKSGVRRYFWTVDNTFIYYLQDNEGDENSHLYRSHITTGETKDLTPVEGARIDIMAYEYRFPDQLLFTMNKRDPRFFDVYRMNLSTGEMTLEVENPGDVEGWLADHQLQVRLAQVAMPDGGKEVRIRDTQNDPWRVLLKVDLDDSQISPEGFAGDNRHLFVVTSLENNTSRLIKVDTVTGKWSVVFTDPEYDISGIWQHPTTYALEGVSIDREIPEIIVLDQALTPDWQFLTEKLGKPFTVTDSDLDDKTWVVASFSDRRPTRYYLFDRPSKTLSFLFSTQPTLEKYTLSPMTPIKFQARDDMTLHGYLTVPAGREAKHLPTVLMVHGGPWVRDSWGLAPQVQWMANRGYAVLQINYRGSTGYGKAYHNAGNREWGAKMHTDLIDGKEWLVKQGISDPQKVAIYGGSYGGYAALVGLTFTPDDFCCGVDIVGPSNLVTLIKTMPPYWAVFIAEQKRRMGGLDEIEFLESRSPLFKVGQIKKPLLIGQGANDPRVKRSESDQIVESMRKKNLPVEYLLFADEGHGFAKPQNRLKFYAATEAFLVKYLGGREEPPAPEENWEALKR